MVMVNDFTEFTAGFEQLPTNANPKLGMYQEYLIENECFQFSNTAMRGERKYFLLTKNAMRNCFEDIRRNLGEFGPKTTYDESQFRDLFSRFFRDPLCVTMGNVQTKALFVLISNIVHLLTEEMADSFNENKIVFTSAKLDTVISAFQGGQSRASIVGYNKIYYGAPSTGKSYAIKTLTAGSPDTVIKTVFHAETQNSDFIGCLKPSSRGDDISYAFQAGPFTDILIKALNDPNRMYYLVIEEINRAPAAAVFGEIFQLLDRNKDGRTEEGYEVTPSDPMQVRYLKEKYPKFNGKMYIPSNLTLLATMNSSDQAVMPMDTAFKRRWKFEYTPLDFEKKCAQGLLNISKTKDEGSFTVSWKDFAQEINRILSEEELPEDRHLGPFFVKDEELENADKALSGKVFMYLWDDILRHKPKSIIFRDDIKTNGALMTCFKNGEPVFNEKLLEALNEKSASQNTTEPQDAAS